MKLTKTLKNGDNDFVISTIKSYLKKLNYYNSVIDNYYTNHLTEAVSDFQNDNNLKATGNLDYATFNMIVTKHNSLEKKREVKKVGIIFTDTVNNKLKFDYAVVFSEKKRKSPNVITLPIDSNSEEAINQLKNLGCNIIHINPDESYDIDNATNIILNSKNNLEKTLFFDEI